MDIPQWVKDEVKKLEKKYPDREIIAVPQYVGRTKDGVYINEDHSPVYWNFFSQRKPEIFKI